MNPALKKIKAIKAEKTIKTFRGFGLVETVVGTAILLVILLGLVQAGQYAFRLVSDANLKIRASFLAEEGIEAIRLLRDTSWSLNIAPAANGIDYYPTFSGGAWQISQTPASLVDGIFDRRVSFSAVYRDANDAITASGGTLDPNARKAIVSVSWMNRGRSATTTISTYFTNLFNN